MFKGPGGGLVVVVELLMHPELTSHGPKAPLRHRAPKESSDSLTGPAHFGPSIR